MIRIVRLRRCYGRICTKTNLSSCIYFIMYIKLRGATIPTTFRHVPAQHSCFKMQYVLVRLLMVRSTDLLVGTIRELSLHISAFTTLLPLPSCLHTFNARIQHFATCCVLGIWILLLSRYLMVSSNPSSPLYLSATLPRDSHLAILSALTQASFLTQWFNSRKTSIWTRMMPKCPNNIMRML